MMTSPHLGQALEQKVAEGDGVYDGLAGYESDEASQYSSVSEVDSEEEVGCGFLPQFLGDVKSFALCPSPDVAQYDMTHLNVFDLLVVEPTDAILGALKDINYKGVVLAHISASVCKKSRSLQNALNSTADAGFSGCLLSFDELSLKNVVKQVTSFRRKCMTNSTPPYLLLDGLTHLVALKPAHRKLFHGVVVRNPTMHADGRMKISLGPEHNALTAGMKIVAGEYSVRSDFLCLAVEELWPGVGVTVLHGELAIRFVKWCADKAVIGWITFGEVTPSKMHMLPTSAVGSEAVIDDVAVTQFLTSLACLRADPSRDSDRRDVTVSKTLSGVIRQLVREHMSSFMGDERAVISANDIGQMVGAQVEQELATKVMNMLTLNRGSMESWVGPMPTVPVARFVSAMSVVYRTLGDLSSYQEEDDEDDIDDIGSAVLRPETRFRGIADVLDSLQAPPVIPPHDLVTLLNPIPELALPRLPPTLPRPPRVSAQLATTQTRRRRRGFQKDMPGARGIGRAPGRIMDSLVFPSAFSVANLSERSKPASTSVDPAEEVLTVLVAHRKMGVPMNSATVRRVVNVQRSLRDKGLLLNLTASSEREVFTGEDENSMRIDVPPKLKALLDKLDWLLDHLDDEQFQPVLDAFPDTTASTKGKQLRGVDEQLSWLRRDLTSPVSDDEDALAAVTLWECEPSGLSFVALGQHYQFWAVAEVDQGVTNIYLSSEHPNPLESAIYCYFQLSGYSQSQCVLLERLGCVQMDPTEHTGNVPNGYHYLSERMAYDLLNSSDRELASFVLGARRKKAEALQRYLRQEQRHALVHLNYEIAAAARYRLIDHTSALADRERHLRACATLVQSWASPNCQEARHSRNFSAAERLIIAASWNATARSALTQVLRILDTGIQACETGMLTSELHMRPCWTMGSSLVLVGRAACMHELMTRVRDMNPVLVREPDLATIYAEFLGFARLRSEKIFGVDQLKLGSVLYDVIREQFVREDWQSDEVADQVVSDAEDPAKLKLGFYLKKFGDGMFFAIPTLVNTVLVLMTGMGIYSSAFVDNLDNEAISEALILSFIITGGINSLIARLAGLYMFQWSFAAALLLLLRVAVGGGVLIVLFFLVRVLIEVALGESGTHLLVSFAFGIVFSLFQMSVALLFNSRITTVWDAKQGKMLLGSILLLIVLNAGVCLPMQASFGYWNCTWVHIGSLGVADVVMMMLVFRTMHGLAVGMAPIQPTDPKAIVAWYAALTRRAPPPDADDDGKLVEWFSEQWSQKVQKLVATAPIQAQTAQQTPVELTGPPGVKDGSATAASEELPQSGSVSSSGLSSAGSLLSTLQTRYVPAVLVRMAKIYAEAYRLEARSAFQRAVARKEVKGKSHRRQRASVLPMPQPHPVADRLTRLDDELLLVRWYCLLTERKMPPVASSEWDDLMKVGNGMMTAKRKTDDVHRGGTLWTLGQPNFWHGTFFFAMLFLDRLIRLTLGEGDEKIVFVASTFYETGALYALIFLLISFSALEPVIDRRAPLHEYYMKSSLDAVQRQQDEALKRSQGVHTQASSIEREFRATSLAMNQTYLREMLNVVGAMVFSFAATTGLMIFNSIYFTIFQKFELSQGLFLLFTQACVGHVGFTLGAYNTIYLGLANQRYSTLSLGVAALLAYGFGMMLVSLTSCIDCAVYASMLGEWTFFVLTAVAVRRSIRTSSSLPRRTLLLTPSASANLSTSGQRWISSPHLPGLLNRTSIAQRLSAISSAVGIMPDSTIGTQITATLTEARNRAIVATAVSQPGRPKSEDSYMKMAFPQASVWLDQLLSDWLARRVQLVLVHHKDLEFLAPLRFAGLGVSIRGSTLYVYVGTVESNQEDEVGWLACEALVHEYAEHRLGLEHGVAVFCELLICPQTSGLGQVLPLRMQRELEQQNTRVLRSLIARTDEIVLESLMLGVNLDREWRSLSEGIRAHRVTLLELFEFDQGTKSVKHGDVTKYQRTSPWWPATKILSDGEALSVQEDVLSRKPYATTDVLSAAGRGWTRSNLAVAVSVHSRLVLSKRTEVDAITGGGEPNRTEDQPDRDEHVANILGTVADSRVAATVLRNTLADSAWLESHRTRSWSLAMLLAGWADCWTRLHFLAYSADTSFPLEWASAMELPVREGGVGRVAAILMWPLFGIFKLNTPLVMWIMEIVLSSRPSIQLMCAQLNHGLHRIVHRSRRGGSSIPRMVTLTPGTGDRETCFVLTVPHALELCGVKPPWTAPRNITDRDVVACVFKGDLKTLPGDTKTLHTMLWYSREASSNGWRLVRCDSISAGVPLSVMVLCPRPRKRTLVRVYSTKGTNMPHDSDGSIPMDGDIRDISKPVDAGASPSAEGAPPEYPPANFTEELLFNRAGLLQRGIVFVDGSKIFVSFTHVQMANRHRSVGRGTSAIATATFRLTSDVMKKKSAELLGHNTSVSADTESASTTHLYHGGLLRVQWHPFVDRVESAVWWPRPDWGEDMDTERDSRIGRTRLEVLPEVPLAVLSRFDYRHPTHPKVYSSQIDPVTGRVIRRHTTPTLVTKDPFSLLKNTRPALLSSVSHGVTAKVIDECEPTRSWLGRCWGWLVPRRPRQVFLHALPTSLARNLLWKEWTKGGVEGAMARVFEEKILRREPVLAQYWKARDTGRILGARSEIELHLSEISARMHFAPQKNSHSYQRFTVADLAIMGKGGDSGENVMHSMKHSEEDGLTFTGPSLFDAEDSVQTAQDADGEGNDRVDTTLDSPSARKHAWTDPVIASTAVDNDPLHLSLGRGENVDNRGKPPMSPIHHSTRQLYTEKEETLRIVGLDSGTWPADGGGVASCRRDLVDRLPRLRWLMQSEVGNPWKVIAYQSETNVEKVRLIPLWGTEQGGPSERILCDVPYCLLAKRAWRTDTTAIYRLFLPLLRDLSHMMCIQHPSGPDLEAMTTVMTNMYLYFQEYDWQESWSHPATWLTWRASMRENDMQGVETPFCESLDGALKASAAEGEVDTDDMTSLFSADTARSMASGSEPGTIRSQLSERTWQEEGDTTQRTMERGGLKPDASSPSYNRDTARTVSSVSTDMAGSEDAPKDESSSQVEPQDSILLRAERGNTGDYDALLQLIMHFLMPIAMPIPSDTHVVHATHHGIQAVVGAIARRLYGCSFVIWDHGVLWRERVKALSEVVSFSLSMRNGMVDLTRVIASVNLHNVDTLLPCTAVGNPLWEEWVGSGWGDTHRLAQVRRRVTPVINGMETDRFQPMPAIEEERPTAVMLSHVYDLKDVKNAIMAADVIVHQYHLKSFHLLVYGGLNKDVEYVAECYEIISSKGLAGNVTLAGLGAAPKVLPRGWVFVNSSKSEGLPLALGEAGLAGLPVVCTDVGGSRQVVRSDAEDITFGAVVPPQQSANLARAILNVLGMLEGLPLSSRLPGEYPPPGEAALDPLTLEQHQPTDALGPKLEDRLQATKTARRRLGLRYRAFVKENFGMARYLRQHEQNIWIGALRVLDHRLEVEALARGLVGSTVSGLAAPLETQSASGSGATSQAGADRDLCYDPGRHYLGHREALSIEEEDLLLGLYGVERRGVQSVHQLMWQIHSLQKELLLSKATAGTRLEQMQRLVAASAAEASRDGVNLNSIASILSSTQLDDSVAAESTYLPGQLPEAEGRPGLKRGPAATLDSQLIIAALRPTQNPPPDMDTFSIQSSIGPSISQRGLGLDLISRGTPPTSNHALPTEVASAQSEALPHGRRLDGGRQNAALETSDIGSDTEDVKEGTVLAGSLQTDSDTGQTVERRVQPSMGESDTSDGAQFIVPLTPMSDTLKTPTTPLVAGVADEGALLFPVEHGAIVDDPSARVTQHDIEQALVWSSIRQKPVSDDAPSDETAPTLSLRSKSEPALKHSDVHLVDDVAVSAPKRKSIIGQGPLRDSDRPPELAMIVDQEDKQKPATDTQGLMAQRVGARVPTAGPLLQLGLSGLGSNMQLSKAAISTGSLARLGLTTSLSVAGSPSSSKLSDSSPLSNSLTPEKSTVEPEGSSPDGLDVHHPPLQIDGPDGSQSLLIKHLSSALLGRSSPSSPPGAIPRAPSVKRLASQTALIMPGVLPRQDSLRTIAQVAPLSPHSSQFSHSQLSLSLNREAIEAPQRRHPVQDDRTTEARRQLEETISRLALGASQAPRSISQIPDTHPDQDAMLSLAGVTPSGGYPTQRRRESLVQRRLMSRYAITGIQSGESTPRSPDGGSSPGSTYRQRRKSNLLLRRALHSLSSKNAGSVELPATTSRLSRPDASGIDLISPSAGGGVGSPTPLSPATLSTASPDASKPKAGSGTEPSTKKRQYRILDLDSEEGSEVGLLARLRTRISPSARTGQRPATSALPPLGRRQRARPQPTQPSGVKFWFENDDTRAPSPELSAVVVATPTGHTPRGILKPGHSKNVSSHMLHDQGLDARTRPTGPIVSFGSDTLSHEDSGAGTALADATSREGASALPGRDRERPQTGAVAVDSSAGSPDGAIQTQAQLPVVIVQPAGVKGRSDDVQSGPSAVEPSLPGGPIVDAAPSLHRRRRYSLSMEQPARGRRASLSMEQPPRGRRASLSIEQAPRGRRGSLSMEQPPRGRRGSLSIEQAPRGRRASLSMEQPPRGRRASLSYSGGGQDGPGTSQDARGSRGSEAVGESLHVEHALASGQHRKPPLGPLNTTGLRSNSQPPPTAAALGHLLEGARESNMRWPDPASWTAARSSVQRDDHASIQIPGDGDARRIGSRGRRGRPASGRDSPTSSGGAGIVF